MEFTPELLAFQGMITSVNDVHEFSKITTKGGNKEKLQYIIDKLTKFLKEKNYITEDGSAVTNVPEMRKLALFLVLNTEFPFLEKMAKLDGINSIINTIPTLTKYLLCELFWNIPMEKFSYEIIIFCDTELALEVARAFTYYIKYLKPAECLDKVKQISSAIYMCILRLHFFDLDAPSLSNTLKTAFESFQKCIGYFANLPNKRSLDGLAKDEVIKLQGNCIHTVLILISECLGQFTSKQKFELFDLNNLYLLTHKEGNYKNEILTFNMCDTPNKSILECLNKCNEEMLDKCKELVMDVTLDTFCAWCEFEEAGKSMQQAIGELCYNLREKLQGIGTLAEHPVTNMLQEISCKPIDFNEIINFVDSKTIVENIQKDNEEKPLWIHALLNKNQGELCQDMSLLNCLFTNINILSDEEIYKLFKMINNCIKQYSGDKDPNRSLELLAIIAYRNCNDSVKQKILEEHFQQNFFNDLLETTEFSNAMMEIFNKLVASSDEDLSHILIVFLQSPQKVYTKIFELASENVPQCEIMLKVMAMLEKYSNYYYEIDTEPCVIRVVHNIFDHKLDTEIKRRNFVNFVHGLKRLNIIPGAKLLLLIVMPHLHKGILDKDIDKINVQMQLLHTAFQLEEHMPYRAPLLAMLGQVLNTLRYFMNTFAKHTPATLQLTLEMQKSLFNTYESGIPENESNWLKSKLRELHPLNMYYYRKLWNPPGNNFIEIISNSSLHRDMDIEQLASFLATHVIYLTQEEWYDVWDSLAIFGPTMALDILHDALCIVTVAETNNRTDSTWACLQHCYRNFVLTTRYKYLVEPLNNQQVVTVVHKIATTANIVEEERTDELGTVLLPLLAYLVERKSDHTVDVSECLRNKLRRVRFANAVNQVFVNGC